jgi:hypothetical protein
MPRTTPSAKAETLTFRIEPALKAAFARIADQEDKPVGELLRDLVRERVERKRRRAFEAEARRQSLEAAALVRDPASDEAAVMREMDAELTEFFDEWK